MKARQGTVQSKLFGDEMSKLFPLIGCNGTRLKEIFAEQDLVAAWPAGHHSEIVPFR